MAKKSPAELKAEGAELSTLIAAVRKRPHFFALLIGKEGLVLEAHPKKSADIMRRQAKANGGGAKGAQGTMTLSGKVLSLNCEDDNFPGSLPKTAKKHFIERGLSYRIVMVLPDGGALSDDDDEDEKTAKPVREAKPDDAQGRRGRRAADGDDPAPPPRPTETPAEAPDASSGGTAPSAPPPGGDTDTIEPDEGTKSDDHAEQPDLKAEILAKLKKSKDLIDQALGSSNDKAAKKVEAQLGIFGDAVSADNLDRAASTLTLLLKTASDVAKRFPPVDASKASDPIELPSSVKSLFADAWGSAMETVGEITEAAGDLKDHVVETAEQMAEDYQQSQRLAGANLKQETIDALVLANRDDPKAIDTALADIGKLAAFKVQPNDMSHLLMLKTTSPKAYDAAVKALNAMDSGGAVDLSPTAVATAMKTLQDLRNKKETVTEDWREKNKAAEEAEKKAKASKAERDRLQTQSTAAQKAVADFQKAHPAPLSLGDNAKLLALQAASALVGGALATAQTTYSADSTALTGAKADLQTAVSAYWAADALVVTAQEAQQKIDDKRDLLKALNYGPLSEGADPALDEASKEKLIEAYGKCPALGRTALDLVSDSEDPTLIVENVGFVADKFADGFADKHGNKIAAGDEDRALMASNALRMGAREGQGYFDGFKTYLEGGDQTKPDPSGAETVDLDRPKSVAAVNTKRSAAMADAVMDGSGKVDFSAPDAKAGIDHLLYHPGSLRVPAPAMIDQVRGMEKNFADPAVGPGMQATLDGTALPVGGTVQANNKRATATKIVQGTVGRTPPPPINDLDAKQAVMSAMISPLSQGPVGSCFTTAAVRKVRMQDPARAMGEFSKIASTGVFTAADGTSIPANTSPSKGENPLMRSWEYSVASAASNAGQSNTRNKMNNALFGGGSGDNLAALGAPHILGADWNDTPVDGKLADGMRTKLRKAIQARITFNYDAGPARSSSGGGDGSSKTGIVEVIFDRTTTITKKEEFVDAIKTIALETTGETETSPKGIEIVKIIKDPNFIKAITDSGGSGAPYMPWDDASSVFGRQTTKVLEGGSPMEAVFLAKEESGQDPGERARALLDGIAALPALDSAGGPDDRPVMWTANGARGANHNFALLPNDPSFLALKNGDLAANIQSQLLDPGAKIADTEMPADECAALFEDEVRRLAATWELEPATIDTLLTKAPDDAMKPADLKAHISSVMEDARKAEETEKLDKWKGEQSSAPSAAQIEAQRELLEESTNHAKTSGIDTALVDKFDPPEVVIADTNWGGPHGQTYFVIAPDPASGELKLWTKNDGDGKLVPASDGWTDAQWAIVNE